MFPTLNLFFKYLQKCYCKSFRFNFNMKNKENKEKQRKLHCPWWGKIYPLCPVCLLQLSMTFHSLGYVQEQSMYYWDVRAELCQWIMYIHLPCIRFMWGLRFKCHGTDKKVIPDTWRLIVVWCEEWNNKIHLGLNFIFTPKILPFL